MLPRARQAGGQGREAKACESLHPSMSLQSTSVNHPPEWVRGIAVLAAPVFFFWAMNEISKIGEAANKGREQLTVARAVTPNLVSAPATLRLLVVGRTMQLHPRLSIEGRWLRPTCYGVPDGALSVGGHLDDRARLKVSKAEYVVQVTYNQAGLRPTHDWVDLSALEVPPELKKVVSCTTRPSNLKRAPLASLPPVSPLPGP